MVNARHREVLKSLTSKRVESSASNADHGDSDDGSSSSFKDLNFRGFMEEETKALSLMITKKVGKAVKKAMPYYINQTTANIKEMIQKELEEFKMEGFVKESKKDNAITRWLNAVECAFRTSRCEEKNKVNFASNFLRESAKIWWEGNFFEKRKGWLKLCSWKEFKDLFNAEYALAEEIDRIREEFQSLMLTNESVNELWKKFNDMVANCLDKNLSTPTNKLPFPLDVEIADSKVMVISNVYHDVEIKIDDSTFRIDLIPIMLGEFNIVIDMDWLDKYNVVILYTSFEKKSVNDVSVVNEFLDVFRKICQEEVGSRELANIDVVLETTENIETIRERLKAAQDRWENYADNRRKHIKFNVRDFILKRVGEVAYIELPEEMRGIHNTFHVSYLKKWLADESSVITLDDIEIYLELTSREEPKTILGRKLRQLQNKVIPLVKVQMEAS
nr:hypothetical protein [Tanacetum cinerariifolium]